MPDDTWIMLADGAHAEILRYDGPKATLTVLESFDHINAPSRELTATKRGRIADSGPNQRSAYERPTDPKDHEKHLFARQIAEALHKKLAQYERLVLAAPPTQLGELRRELSPQVKQKIKGELDKDLLNQPSDQRRKSLQSVLNLEISTSTITPASRYASG